MRLILYLIVLVTFMSGCKNVQDSGKLTDQNHEENTSYFNFHFERKGDTTSILLKNCEMVKGRFKDNHNSDTIAVPGYLIYKFVDNKFRVIKRFILENPLVENFEFVNAQNSLERKLVYKPTVDYVLRVQYEPGFHFLMIDSLNDKLIPSTIFMRKIDCNESK